MAEKFVEVGLIPIDADQLARDEILKAGCKLRRVWGLGFGVGSCPVLLQNKVMTAIMLNCGI